MTTRRILGGGNGLALIGLALALAMAADCGGGSKQKEGATAGTSGTGAAAMADTISVSGLETPESVLWDPQADVYLVSNINGDPSAHDGNGFISRISPDGRIQSLKWIDGASPGVRLNAPKGLAIIGDTLFVADIDTVRAFHRVSGTPLGERGVPGSTFLNDLAAGPGGALYVTDSGLDPTFKPNGTDAIYRFEGDIPVPIAKGPQLQSPNGILADADSVTFVTFSGDTVDRIPVPTTTGSVAGDSVRHVAAMPAGQLDGIVRTGEGTLLVSSWEGRAIYRMQDHSTVETVVQGIVSPADIGWDSQRHRLLIPVFQENRVLIRTLE